MSDFPPAKKCKTNPVDCDPYRHLRTEFKYEPWTEEELLGAQKALLEVTKDSSFPTKLSKPTFAALILLAIVSSPVPLTLQQIVDFVRSYIHLVPSCGKNWRNSVRHNLTTKKCFVNIPGGLSGNVNSDTAISVGTWDYDSSKKTPKEALRWYYVYFTHCNRASCLLDPQVCINCIPGLAPSERQPQLQAQPQSPNELECSSADDDDDSSSSSSSDEDMPARKRKSDHPKLRLGDLLPNKNNPSICADIQLFSASDHVEEERRGRSSRSRSRVSSPSSSLVSSQSQAIHHADEALSSFPPVALELPQEVGLSFPPQAPLSIEGDSDPFQLPMDIEPPVPLTNELLPGILPPYPAMSDVLPLRQPSRAFSLLLEHTNSLVFDVDPPVTPLFLSLTCKDL